MLWGQIRNRLFVADVQLAVIRRYNKRSAKKGQNFKRTERESRLDDFKIVQAAEFLPNPGIHNFLNLVKADPTNIDIARISKENTKTRIDLCRVKHMWDLGRTELTGDVIFQLSPKTMGSAVNFVADLFLMNKMKESDEKMVATLLKRVNILRTQGGPDSITRQIASWSYQLQFVLGSGLSNLSDVSVFQTSNSLLLACASSKFSNFSIRRELFGRLTAQQKFAIMFSPQFVTHFMRTMKKPEFVDLYLNPNNYPLKTLKRSYFHNMLAPLLSKAGLKHEEISELPIASMNQIPQTDFSETASQLEVHLQDLAKNQAHFTDSEMKQLNVVKQKIDRIKRSNSDRNCFVIDTLNVMLGQSPPRNMNGLRGLEDIIHWLQTYGGGERAPVIFLVCRDHQRSFANNILQGSNNIHVFYAEDLSKDDLATIFIALRWGSKSWIISNDHFGAELCDMPQKLQENLETYLNFYILRHDGSSIEAPCEVERRAVIPCGDRRLICVEDDEYVYPKKRRFLYYLVH